MLELEELENSKKEYQIMNKKIEESIDNLSKANDELKKAIEQLGINYQSKTADQKVGILEEEYTKISDIINILESEILVESNNEIDSIVRSILEKSRELDDESVVKEVYK